MIPEGLLEQIAADIEQQEAEQTTIQIAQTVPYALLQVLGVVLGNVDEVGEAKLPSAEVGFISDTLQKVLNLLGWDAVVTDQNPDGSSVVSLVPLGTDISGTMNESEEV
jgi:hypothetical protein